MGCLFSNDAISSLEWKIQREKWHREDLVKELDDAADYRVDILTFHLQLCEETIVKLTDLLLKLKMMSLLVGPKEVEQVYKEVSDSDALISGGLIEEGIVVNEVTQ